MEKKSRNGYSQLSVYSAVTNKIAAIVAKAKKNCQDTNISRLLLRALDALEEKEATGKKGK